MQKNKFWNFQLAEGDSAGELTLYGDIANATWFGDEVTPKQFKADLEDLGDIKELNIYINSGGGDVFAGQAIYSILKRHESKKTVYVDGLAASIASVIAMAGDVVIMPENAMLMIHNAWTLAAGDSGYFRKLADDMDKINDSILTTYTSKTGRETEEIKDYMDKETWFTAAEALDLGFADQIEKGKQLAASLDGGFLMVNNIKVDLDRYNNKPDPEKIVNEGPDPEPEPKAEQSEDGDRGVSQPVPEADTDIKEQRSYLWSLRKKINEGV